MEEALSDFIIQSLAYQQLDNKQIILGPVTQPLAERLSSESNIDLIGYVFTIDEYAIRHIFKSHGNVQKEEARGQKAITVADFSLIYQILTEPDIVFYDGKNRIGRDVIQFQKRMGNRYIIVKEVRTGQKQLALNSMRIIKAKRNQD